MESYHIAFFLFSNPINKEKIAWIASLTNTFQSSLFFAEDSVYSIPLLTASLKNYKDAKILYNKNDAAKRGLSYQLGVGLLRNDFYDQLLREILSIQTLDKMAYLCLTAPYMTNDCLFGLIFLKSALDRGIIPEFYGYLDGIHLLQPGQSPSEFTNVKNEFLRLRQTVLAENKEFRAYFCSRCATARGYMNIPIIEGASIVNLREIIARIKLGVPCLMSNSLLILNPNYIKTDSHQTSIDDGDTSDASVSEMTIIITHSPYSSEYMFGGLSFGLACANQGIPTQIIFTEDAVFALLKHETDREFDLQEFDILSVVEALDDTDNLSFYYYYPSLRERSLSESIEINYNFIKPVDVHDFCDLLKIKRTSIRFRSVLIF